MFIQVDYTTMQTDIIVALERVLCVWVCMWGCVLKTYTGEQVSQCMKVVPPLRQPLWFSSICGTQETPRFSGEVFRWLSEIQGWGFTCIRVQAFFHQTFQVYHVYWNFILGYICRITINFGILKDGCLLIYIFASNNCFSDRNISQNGVDTLSKINHAFLNKRWTFHLVRVRVIRLCSKFASFWNKPLLWNYKWNFQSSDASICNGNKKFPIVTSTFYTDYAFKLFYISIAVANNIG